MGNKQMHKVLVVDDEEPILELLKYNLEKNGYEVKTAQGTAVGSGATAKKPKDREGVFVVENGLAMFRPVKVGIAGDEHFEVLEGLKAGDTVVAGPYQSVRDLKDSTKVRQAREAGAAGGPKKTP